jgi:hypothetical protein
MKKLLLAVATAAAAALAFAVAAGAAPTSTFGGATTNADGSITLSSTAAQSAGIDLSLPSNAQVGDIYSFSTGYSFANGCPNGVPVLAIITYRGTISVSLASVPGFSCAAGTNSVYVLSNNTPVNSSALPGGSANDTWAHVKSEYDDLRINNVQLVTSGANQTVTVSNVQLVFAPVLPSPSM